MIIASALSSVLMSLWGGTRDVVVSLCRYCQHGVAYCAVSFSNIAWAVYSSFTLNNYLFLCPTLNWPCAGISCVSCQQDSEEDCRSF